MREAEAQEKACPWGVAPKCLARGCMAWVPFLDLYAGRDDVAKVVASADGTRPMERDDGCCARVARLVRGGHE